MTSSLFGLAIKDDLEIIPSFLPYDNAMAEVPTNAQHALRCVRRLVLGNTGVRAYLRVNVGVVENDEREDETFALGSVQALNVGGFQITALIIRRHLEESGFTNSTIGNLLDPADPQDTARALSLLITMQNLGNPAPGSTPRFCATREALRNLGSLRFELGGTQE
ncbi:hypothetical protein B0H16DRAFT_1466208 [Mycena metata]|uniref:Uncharacterized protein n=1 Tax=Mycena metata TaxID=1033252 RepID=A0AAD7MZG7_9AGAR|nr:hypothetical protein B0H16DRAFT_1466205 [Mycena metata]KAJ7737570.1 hypothetical protein B0H16DRAFT_1466208 [Mycena metata]